MDVRRLRLLALASGIAMVAAAAAPAGAHAAGLVAAYDRYETGKGFELGLGLSDRSHELRLRLGDRGYQLWVGVHVEGLDRMRSAGKALPGIELAILDADGKRLPPGEVGEIATRSGSNMVGYWNLPEATAKTLDSDGWLRTGDAGYMDKDGYLYIHDRIKDMIISGGENIYPAEVESALCDHPDVAEAAVIGIPDDKWGEAVKAVVVMKPGKQATATDIVNFTRERIAGFKTPKSVDFLEALPRNPSGKILRRNLRDPYWAGKDRQVN